jgi:hypothetical protein
MALSNDGLNKIYDEIEANRFEFDLQYGNAFRDIANNDAYDLTEEQLKVFEYEFIIFRFMTIDQVEEPKRPRFVPSVTYTDGTVFPDIAGLNDEQLAYYRERSLKTNNPVMKARYLDFLFEFDKTLNKASAVEGLVDVYLEASKTYDHNNEKERIDCLDRAYLLSKRFTKTHPSLLPVTARAMVERLKQQRKENLRWTLEFIPTIIKHPSDFPENSIELCEEIANEGVKHYTEDGTNFILREAFVELRHQIAKILHPKSFDAKQAAKDKAQTYMDEADRRTDSGVVQQHFLMQAHEILHAAGLKDEAAALIKRVEEIGASDGYMAQFQTISVEQELPAKMFQRLREQIKSSSDVGAFVGLSPNLQSSWTALDSDPSKPSGVTDIFPETHINNRGIPVPATDNDVEYRRTLRSYGVDVSFRHILLKETLGKLIREDSLRLDDVLKHFRKIEQFDNKTWLSVEKGLDLFFKGEHFAAVSILIPQFENLLFILLPVVFDSTQSMPPRDGAGLLPKTLSQILSSIRTVIQEDLYQYMSYSLIDVSNMNLRNRAGHGELKVDDDNELYGLIIIQLFLMILVNIKPSGGETTAVD